VTDGMADRDEAAAVEHAADAEAETADLAEDIADAEAELAAEEDTDSEEENAEAEAEAEVEVDTELELDSQDEAEAEDEEEVSLVETQTADAATATATAAAQARVAALAQEEAVLRAKLDAERTEKSELDRQLTQEVTPGHPSLPSCLCLCLCARHLILIDRNVRCVVCVCVIRDVRWRSTTLVPPTARSSLCTSMRWRA
jgi:hypothetical protein